MASSHLRVEHSPAGYRRLLLSRPERRNALDVGLAQALRDTLGQTGRARWCWAAPIPGCSARAPT